MSELRQQLEIPGLRETAELMGVLLCAGLTVLWLGSVLVTVTYVTIHHIDPFYQYLELAVIIPIVLGAVFFITHALRVLLTVAKSSLRAS